MYHEITTTSLLHYWGIHGHLYKLPGDQAHTLIYHAGLGDVPQVAHAYTP